MYMPICVRQRSLVTTVDPENPIFFFGNSGNIFLKDHKKAKCFFLQIFITDLCTITMTLNMDNFVVQQVEVTQM